MTNPTDEDVPFIEGVGIHVVARVMHRDTPEGREHMLQFMVYPLPEDEHVKGLAKALQEAATKYLKDNKLAEGNYTDLLPLVQPPEGPLQ